MHLRLITLMVGLAALVAVALKPQPVVMAGVDAKAHGVELFASKGCAHCHGANGIGGGIGPDLQLVRARMDAKQLVAQIHDGSKEMPAYGDDLSSTEIDDLVTFLRAKRKFVKVPTRPASPVAGQPKPDDGPGI